MKRCSVSGCGNDFRARGMCTTHLQRWDKYGELNKRYVPIYKRFEEKYIPVTESGCWLWTASVTEKGYGEIGVNGKTCRAHRFSWMYHNGPIPDGMCVLHKCDVPACVNPDHLFLGTNADNTADMMAKGRGITTYFLGKFGKLHKASKPVIQMKNGVVVKIWDAVMDADRAGFNGSCIGNCCNGRRKTHKGYTWEYEN